MNGIDPLLNYKQKSPVRYGEAPDFSVVYSLYLRRYIENAYNRKNQLDGPENVLYN